MGNVYIFQWGKNSFWAVFTDSKEKAFKMADLFIRSNHDTRIKYKLVRVLEDGEGILYTEGFTGSFVLAGFNIGIRGR